MLLVTHYQLVEWSYPRTHYGDPLLSVVSETHRLEINQESKMPPYGQWTRKDGSRGVENDQLAEPMFNYIRVIRGNVDTIEQVSIQCTFQRCVPESEEVRVYRRRSIIRYSKEPSILW